MTGEDYQNGQVLLIDKPLHWTSFQVVKKIRSALRRKYGIKKIKVGHAGTLDPLATGLLIVCTGKFTKKIHEYQGLVKAYSGTLKLGATTPSFDMETAVNAHFPTGHITRDVLEKARLQFTGSITQTPPVFSAVKQDGKRLYESARKGENVVVKSRKVHIYAFELTAVNLPEVSFYVQCSKGTYIRSLANDFGKAVASGAYLSELRRTKIGDFRVENAMTPQDFMDRLFRDSD